MTEEIITVSIKKTIELKADVPRKHCKETGLVTDYGHMKGETIRCKTTGKPIILEYLECSEHGGIQNNLALLKDGKPINVSGECPKCRKEQLS